MKAFITALALASSYALAAPAEPPVRSDAATGYASLNGGTTGGAGSSTITVSSYATLATAMTGDDKKVILVSGTITQTADKIRLGNQHQYC